MKTRRAGGAKRWTEQTASRLLDDLDYDADAWETVFEWVLKKTKVGEAYESVLKKAKRWDRRRQYAHVEARVSERFAAKIDVPPDFQGNPETHGIDEPRGGGFSIMQNLQKSLVKEEENERNDGTQKKEQEEAKINASESCKVIDASLTERSTVWHTDGTVVQKERVLDDPTYVERNVFTAAVKEAMYWGGKDRTYRMTKQEQSCGQATCPKCKGRMEKETFTRNEKMFRCSECGFKVPTGKVTTRKIEIEIEPDGGVEVEVTTANCRRN